MYHAVVLKKPLLFPAAILRQQRAVLSCPSGRNLSIWQPSSDPSDDAKQARRTMSDRQASMEMRIMEEGKRRNDMKEERERRNDMMEKMRKRNSRHDEIWPGESAPMIAEDAKPEITRSKRSILVLATLMTFCVAIWYKEHSSTDRNGGGLLPGDPSQFAPYTILSKVPVSSTSTIFTLRPSTPISHISAFERGIWSVELKQPELQISRAYTPLPHYRAENEEDAEYGNDLLLLIRKEYGGEVSNYIHSLPVGANIEIRGPKFEWEFDSPGQAEPITDVIFLAGGTGIAPALQLACGVLGRSFGNPGQEPKINIMWANRRREECEGGFTPTVNDAKPSRKGWSSLFWADASYSPPPTAANPGSLNLNIQYPPPQSDGADPSLVPTQTNPIISTISRFQDTSPETLSIRYKVDEEGSFITPSELEKLIADAKRTTDDIREEGRKLIFVCGPDGFLDHFSGPKRVFRDGREVENEEVGGVLGRLGNGNALTNGGWEVVRL